MKVKVKTKKHYYEGQKKDILESMGFTLCEWGSYDVKTGEISNMYEPVGNGVTEIVSFEDILSLARKCNGLYIHEDGHIELNGYWEFEECELKN